MTKQLTAAARQELARQERKFKSAVVRFACGIYTDALRDDISGDDMNALQTALNDVGALGPEELRDLAWAVLDLIQARTASLGLMI